MPSTEPALRALRKICLLELWVDRYIPKTLDEYVWRDASMRAKFEECIRDGALPHLLFSGKAGVGKTSLAKLLLKMLGVPSGDILFVKASKERKVETFETKIMGFVQTYPMIDNPTGVKYVILDEVDALSELAQKFLRSEIEDYSATVRFILTCNYPMKLMEPIRSRCQEFHFDGLSMEEFLLRVLHILDAESVEADQDALTDYVEESYPDLRKCIGLLQKNTVDKVLQPRKEVFAQTQHLTDAIKYFEQGQYIAARKLIASNVSHEEYPDVFRFLYENIKLFADNQDQEDDGLVIIRDGLYKHNLIADPELNISATIVQLIRMRK